MHFIFHKQKVVKYIHYIIFVNFRYLIEYIMRDVILRGTKGRIIISNIRGTKFYDNPALA